MNLVYTITLNTETNEVGYYGNMNSQQALQTLMAVVIEEGVKQRIKEKEDGTTADNTG